MASDVALPGLGLRAVAAGTVKKNRELATTGPYAFTRNPLYFGSILIGIGFGVAARNGWIALAIVAMFLAIYLPVIRSEEKFLRSQFPGFDEYARRVPRLLPRLFFPVAVTTSRTMRSHGTFSENSSSSQRTNAPRSTSPPPCVIGPMRMPSQTRERLAA